ncbi:hypothetical protein GCK72_001668 [Caenorhabditis remanei]|uniref:Uncharacterized protein n=2 Tax=Caenorhabditis remanei TaxID=31234 RepID=A0A6A5HRG0_CAERE|nr:hypothetical protein GCK72_001668 [Caenorhabditis remanei]KAF1769851.1 hypothetical protein GCK72_001668 [Caenorhabditis remanei]
MEGAENYQFAYETSSDNLITRFQKNEYEANLKRAKRRVSFSSDPPQTYFTDYGTNKNEFEPNSSSFNFKSKQ